MPDCLFAFLDPRDDQDESESEQKKTSDHFDK